MLNAKVEPKTVYKNIGLKGQLKSLIQVKDIITDDTKCLVPKWTVVLCGFGYCFIAIILISALAVVFFANAPAFYQQSCISRSCFKSLNLKCLNKTCLCDTGYFYIDKCLLKKDYMQQCNDDSYCKDNTSMVCRDGTCTCDNSNYWNGGACISKSTYQQSCTNDNQCFTEKVLYCDSKSKKCSCNNNTR